MLNRPYKFLLASLFFTLLTSGFTPVLAQGDQISDDPEVINTGKQLFEGNCKTCHKIHEKYIGPALQNVYNRAPSIDWIKQFVYNSSKVIQSGDDYANDLYDEYQGVMMPGFPFEDEQTMAILAYLKQETDKGPEEQATASTAEGAPAGQEGTAEKGPSTYLTTILIGLVIVLVLILGVLGMILGILRRYINQQEDIDEESKEVVNQSYPLGKMLTSRPVIFLTTFIITALIIKGVINGLFSIGVQKGYKPTQPIAYSHELHAGQYQIDCNYCHTGVTKSRSANIPSANICMNCHSAIKTESPEIQKIYASIEENKPIEWVRIHNLPDLAYFNHSQHVKVGELECQTCHGNVEEMEVVEQKSLLTMGWCIECHRTTEVNSKGNDYYDKLLEYHKNKDVMVVEDIGGLECAKCHY